MNRVRRLRPWMLVSAAWIGPAILGAIQVAAQHRLWGNEGPVDIRQVLFVSIDWLVYALLTPGVFLLARHFPLARPRLARHSAMHLAFSLLFCFFWAGLGTVLRVLLDPGGLDGGLALHFVNWFLVTLPFGVAVYLAVVGIEHAIRYFEEARERETQVARLSEQLTGARLAALQAQLNPHFLFNSLNTIAVLVRDGNGPAATKVIDQLSEVLRRTLSDSAASEVSLGDELELVTRYLAVEQARFSDRLRPVLDADPSLLAAAVPRFAVQHLVENAVRHGIARRSDAGGVVITARRDGDVLEVTVTDDGPGIAGDSWPAGHGLANTRERLHTLYGLPASLTVSPAPTGGTVARLRVPYREVLLERTENDES